MQIYRKGKHLLLSEPGRSIEGGVDCSNPDRLPGYWTRWCIKNWNFVL